MAHDSKALKNLLILKANEQRSIAVAVAATIAMEKNSECFLVTKSKDLIFLHSVQSLISVFSHPSEVMPLSTDSLSSCLLATGVFHLFIWSPFLSSVILPYTEHSIPLASNINLCLPNPHLFFYSNSSSMFLIACWVVFLYRSR